jgi:hypothetical protein
MQIELENLKLNKNNIDYPTLVEKLKNKKEKEIYKQKEFSKKQDKLLFTAFYILLNLAEDIVVEKKMIKKSLLLSLEIMLNRTFEDLLILCITFLKKLSIIEENKEVIKNLKIIEKLTKFLTCSSQPLITITLRFLFNLSFDRVLIFFYFFLFFFL